MTTPIDITPEAVANMLDGVTKGPWTVDGPPWNQAIWSSAENRVAFMAHSNGLNDNRDIATARFIAYAREAVPALSAERAALKTDVTTYQAMVMDLTAEGEALRAKLEEAAQTLKTQGDSAATEALNQRLCCDGRDCGCRGATVEEWLDHLIRALITPDMAQALAALIAEARREGWNAALEASAALVEGSVYTSNGGARTLEPVSPKMRGMDMHHATIAVAIRALKEETP